ncbi:MAG: alpha-L-fucosidase, partial [Planctomycetota bacterium]|nr:alpha-L-fucosidase [Planctomycetota bacterium]
KEMRKHRPFEECRGIGHSFAFNRAENYDIYDSRTACVQRLVDLVSRGGVLLLDIGPTADGRIPLIMVDRLLAIGAWLEVNGEAIKGTRRSPFRALPWGRATTKGDSLYLHVFDWPVDDRLVVPGLENQVRRATMLGDRKADRVLAVERTGDAGVEIDLGGLHPFEHATVIKLELEGEPRVDESIRPRADGTVELSPAAATLAGPSLRVERYADPGGREIDNLGYWLSTEPTATWTARLVPGQEYEIEIDLGCRDQSAGGELELACGGGVHRIPVPATGGWDRFETRRVGRIVGPEGGEPVEFVLEAIRIPGDAVGNVRGITLRPLGG